MHSAKMHTREVAASQCEHVISDDVITRVIPPMWSRFEQLSCHFSFGQLLSEVEPGDASESVSCSALKDV